MRSLLCSALQNAVLLLPKALANPVVLSQLRQNWAENNGAAFPKMARLLFDLQILNKCSKRPLFFDFVPGSSNKCRSSTGESSLRTYPNA
jgi:hypothetical protein